MSFLRRLGTLLVLCSPALARCQDPSNMVATPTDEQVTTWLDSGDPRLAAWGASAILAEKRTNLLPRLEDIVASYTRPRGPSSGDGNRDQLRALVPMLDAVIQLEGRLPAKVLERLDGSLNTQEMLLLKELPWGEAGPIWKALYQPGSSTDDRSTRVAAEMLAQHPPPGFAADLLRRSKVQANVIVFTPGGVGSGSGSSSSCCGGVRRQAADWPEAGSYAFQDSAKKDGAKLWLEGEDPIYLVREVNRTYWPSVCGGFSGLTDAMRLHLVGTMLHSDQLTNSLQPNAEVRIEFHGREEYRAQVAAFVEGQQEAFAKVTTALTIQGLMTEDERQSAGLAIHLALQDFREEGAVDLPPIAFRPPVEWVGGEQR